MICAPAEMEPMVPSAAERLKANVWLLEMAYGKAVVQTEIMKAEANAVHQEQLAAMSVDELHQFVYGRPLHELPSGTEPSEPSEDDPH
jgi:hypothetical protein